MLNLNRRQLVGYILKFQVILTLSILINLFLGNEFAPNSCVASPLMPSVELISSKIHNQGRRLTLTFSFHLPKSMFISIPASASQTQIRVDFDRGPPIKSQNIQWPASTHLSKNGVRTKALQGDFVLPIILELTEPIPVTSLRGKLWYTYCSNTQCILTQTSFQDRLARIEGSSEALPLFSSLSFWSVFLVLGSAFLGGIFLNFMPCVLPVLSMKITALVEPSTGDLAKRREVLFFSFFGYLFGIMTFFVSFVFLGAFLQMGGYFLGWGSHFQNVYFLSLLIVFLILCFLSSWGIFEFKIPSFLGTIFYRYTSVPKKVSSSDPRSGCDLSKELLWKNYRSGLLMSLLSTPCTAPFLGGALGLSLFFSFWMKVFIFLSVALGLSLPFGLLLISRKYLFGRLKPGPWMETLKKTLSFGFLGTALWLGWVLLSSMYDGVSLNAKHQQSATQDGWHPLSSRIINKCAQEQKPLLVNITASWCLTCLANELSTFKDKSVTEALRKKNVYKMQGNWTHHSQEVEDYLHQFGRIGIPLTVLYGPNCPNGKVLSELLSSRSLLSALNECLQ